MPHDVFEHKTPGHWSLTFTRQGKSVDGDNRPIRMTDRSGFHNVQITFSMSAYDLGP